MIQVKVFFKFETKEEWLEFANKLTCKPNFTQYLINLKEFVKNYPLTLLIESRSDELNSVDKRWLNFVYQISTRSEKTLRQLNDWIKENHYESNYVLRKSCYDRMNISFDKLFEECSNKANKRIN